MGDETIGKYRVLKHLATGGMGEVFLARQDGLRGFTKLVVVKRLLPQFARDPNFLEMFLNEARLAAQLHHPNIVQVFDLGEEGGLFFIAMEFVHGASLRTVKQVLTEAGKTLEPRLAASLCAQALNGLHHAHTLQDDAGQLLRLVHRDVSPDNLLVGFDGVVKVVDFGIAKATASVSTTTTGTVKGKFAYMAPEYLAGDPIDGRADVYSMGVVLYELLSGTRPFRGNSEPALIMSIMRDEPPPLHEKAPAVPAVLEAIVNRALAKDPAKRFQSAQQMATELERFVAGQVAAGDVHTWLSALLGPDATRRPSSDGLVAVGPSRDVTMTVERKPVQKKPAAQTTLTPLLDDEVPRPAASGAPTGLAPAHVPAPPRAVETALAPALTQAAEPVSEWSPNPQGSRRPVLWLALAATVVLVVAGVLWLRGPKEPTTVTTVVPLVEVRGEAAIVPPADASVRAEPPALVEAVVDAGSTTVVALATDTDAGAEPVEPRPVKPEAKTGRVNLVVLPWAEVRHNGALLGITPLDELQLPKGAQTLVLTNPELGVTKKVQVRVPAGGSTTVKVDLMAE
ncbi:MAG: protein kinase [Myxococcales bacterium]|nr:protein kinase [Myxococcales bacterium]